MVKKKLPRMPFFRTVQSSKSLELRETVGEDARASEKLLPNVNTTSMPCRENFDISISFKNLRSYPYECRQAHLPLFVTFVSKKRHLDLAVEPLPPEWYP